MFEKRWKTVVLLLFNSGLFLKFENVWTKKSFSLRRNSEPTNQGFLAMLLVVLRLICHISVMEHFSQDFSKENFVDSEFEIMRNDKGYTKHISDSGV